MSKSTQNIEGLLQKWNIQAVIFDLDGTLIDNNSFHLRSWQEYLKNNKMDISEEAFRKNINGRTNKDAIEYIYGRKMSEEESWKYTLEKEAVYRKLYAPHIRPVKGLPELLETIDELHIPMAIATSGIQVNIDFMFSYLPIKKYFQVVVNSAHIARGKPDPEIYLKTAEQLCIPAQDCLVFEDAAVGVTAARSACMKVIAVTTTQTKEELSDADMIIENYDDENFI